MLISHKHKFIVVNIPKTGTRSLRETLTAIGAIDFTGGQKPIKGSSLWQHTTSFKAKAELEYWDEYFKYTTVRNPWDRYISLFSYWKGKASDYKKNAIPPHPGAMNQGKHAARLFEGRSDAELLAALIGSSPSQDKYFTDANKSVIVDHIARLEKVNDEFNFLCDKVGINSPVKLNHSNKSKKQIGIGDLYTQELIDMVAEKESVVISLKNYTFAGRKIK